MNEINNEPKRIKLTVAYDGTAYNGYQFQPTVPTVEGELKRALTELLDEEITLVSASRTDTGVHALCNIAVFDTVTPIPAKKLPYAINQRLPEDIRIQHAETVALDFHPRRTESRKTYQYRIWNADFPLPTKRLYHHYTYQYLNVGQMQKAAEYLVGEHDFASFCTAAPKKKGTDSDFPKSTVRTIYKLDIIEDIARLTDRVGQHNRENFCPSSFTHQNLSQSLTPNPRIHPAEVTITVTGNGFLYNMVRIIAGTLIEVGTGRCVPEQLPEILAAKERSKAGPTAPANGLTLVKYEYL
ncbi:MAG: tRNA pseudouridine(38-40) synthase TruA [Lachnospiraceae bacterium]|nr:tRNA pseudouridine(38-40) synthase TruA [Lachnospiraceae bacterium]